MGKQHVFERTIMWGDLDSLGIVFYPRYYEWMDACCHLFFDSIHLNLGKLQRERKLIFGLAETVCRYHKPGRYHQRIRIITGIETVGQKALIMKHRFYCQTTDHLMVEGTENRICMEVSDPENLKAVNIPEDIQSILKNEMEKGVR